MLAKTVFIASSIALASASGPAVNSNGDKLKAKQATRTSAVASSGVASSTAVTTGSWAEESQSSCSSLNSSPVTYGYTLGACQGSFFSGSSSKYTSCEWNADKTALTVYSTDYTSSDCSGTGSTSTYLYNGLVNGCSSFYTYNFKCGSDVAYSNYGSPQHIADYNSGTCSGSESAWTVYSYDSCTDDSGCIYWTDSYSTKGICDDPDDTCFHVDTKIDYKGVEYTYEELKAGKEPECTVPHSPSSKGVVITTSCDKTVRVTDTHLMATTKGFQLAYSLKAGDVLYGDYGSNMCTVKSVEKEKTTQQYFGLNCVHSEVLASGLRASTFGDFHTLPSWYMTYVGGMIGTDAASSLGEYIAEWYFQK